MAPKWTHSIINKLDPNLLSGLNVTQTYPRPIIDVDWRVMKVHETTELGHDALIITGQDDEGATRDIVIIKQSYPGNVTELDSLVSERIVGVNPMYEYVRENDQRALLCKYARLIIGSNKRFNPHVGIDAHKHEVISNGKPLYADDALEGLDSLDRAPFETSDAAAPVKITRKTASSNALIPGGTIQPSSDVTIRWDNILA